MLGENDLRLFIANRVAGQAGAPVRHRQEIPRQQQEHFQHSGGVLGADSLRERVEGNGLDLRVEAFLCRVCAQE